MPPDGGMPRSLIADPDYLDARRHAVVDNRDDVHEEQLDRLDHPEIMRRPRTAQEVLHFVEAMSWEEFREARLEQKYGTGMMAQARAFLAGEHDVSIEEDGEAHHSYFNDMVRRGIKFFNRRTAVGLGVLAVTGFFTGGAGMMAGGAFLGRMAGRGVAEGWGVVSGAERKAREDLLQAELAIFYELKRLANEYHQEADHTVRAGILRTIVDLFHGASTDALGERLQVMNERLRGVQTRHEIFGDQFETVGGFAGLGVGAYEAYQAATYGGIEGGKAAFGKVETDLHWPMHYVGQANGEWQFVYNNATEAAQAHAHGASVFYDPASNEAVHAYGNSVWKIWANATAKALPVLGAMQLAKMTEQPPASRNAPSRTLAEDERLAHRRVMETLEGTRPIEAELQVQEAVLHDVWDVAPLGAIGVINQTPPLHASAWNPAWRVLQVAAIDDAHDQITLHLFRNDRQFTRGTQDASLVVDHQEFARMVATGMRITPNWEQENNRGRLETRAFKDFIEQSEGKHLVFYPRARVENLAILVNDRGWPVPGTLLNERNRYTMMDYNLEQNLAHLRDARTGDMVTVDLFRLRNAVERFAEVPTAAEQPGGADGTRTADPELQEARNIFRANNDPEPTTHSVWILEAGRSIDGETVEGDDRSAITIDQTGSYEVRDYRRREKIVVIKSLLDANQPPVEVPLVAFARTFGSESRLIEQLFIQKAAAGENVPADNRVLENQVYWYQHPTENTPRYWRVSKVPGEQVEVTALTGAPPAAPGAPAHPRVKKMIDRYRLAGFGDFTP